MTGSHAQNDILAALQAQLGVGIVAGRGELEGRRFADWSGVPADLPIALVRPRTTLEVSQAIALCHAANQPVVVIGGLTGLAGGACVQSGEVAISLERMTGIEHVDPVSGTMTVLAGTTLQQVQEEAARHGLYFALDLGSRGSCTIGGNIATNAGGVRVIKYGMMREQVLGIEAVLADGKIINNLHGMVKNNTGYDLCNLLAASEGTLAVITRAVLRLRPNPLATATAWCALRDFEAVKQLLVGARSQLGDGLSAFEVMWASFYDTILEHVPNLRRPVAGNHPFHVILETNGADEQQVHAQFEAFLARCFEQGIVEDAVIAQSENDALDFWAIRECPEMATMVKHPVVFDISSSANDIDELARRCEQAIATRWPESRFAALGHMGDGNIHIIVEAPNGSHETHDAIEDAIYGCVEELDGSVSAEHGIGLKKLRVLHHTRDEIEIGVMRSIKQALDPLNILGRGRVIPA